MNEKSTPAAKPHKIRFEGTVHPDPERGMDMARLNQINVDRIPDPHGEVRVLVDADQLQRLLESGFEVRLRRALPAQPLDRSLVADDDAVQAWFDERTAAARSTGER